MVWVRCDHDGGSPCEDWEIYLWDGATTTNISNQSGSDYSPSISGSIVVWRGWAGSSGEIFLWDGATTSQISNGSRFDDAPAISGSNVVWQGRDGTVESDDEIYMTDISEPNPVPSISFGGLALLGGLVLAIALAGLAVQRRRRAL